MEPVYCSLCANVERGTRKQATYAWLCLMFPRKPKGAIAPHVMDVDAPYSRCVDVNAFNNCNRFEPLKHETE